jgi:hypothetical protein
VSVLVAIGVGDEKRGKKGRKLIEGVKTVIVAIVGKAN